MEKAREEERELRPTRVRLDKWLWAARFFKTRSLAAHAIAVGHVRISDARVKPAHMVQPGDHVTVRKDAAAWKVEVIALSARRGSATEASTLYRESADSVAARQAEIDRRRAAGSAPAWQGRPTKRERRKLREFLDEA